VSAIGRPFTFNVAVGLGDGLRVGNRPEALPPGLSFGLVVGMLGSEPTGIGDVAGVAGVVGLGRVVGVTDPDMVTAATAIGSLGRLAALPITVSRTNLTVDAVRGTVDSA
jgi:hypothetical protein